MLAFIDSPIQLLLAAVVILVVFGPQKLPEIAGQIGRALRELKRTTGDLQDSFNLDNNHRYDQHYDPPHYDSYGNPTTSTDTTTPSVPESDVWQPSTPETKSIAASASEPVHGDFAASALSEGSSDYVYGVTAPSNSGASAYSTPSTVGSANGTGAAHTSVSDAGVSAHI